MVGVVEGFRWALFGNAELLVAPMAISVAFVALLLIGGAYYFRSVEMVFAEPDMSSSNEIAILAEGLSKGVQDRPAPAVPGAEGAARAL